MAIAVRNRERRKALLEQVALEEGRLAWLEQERDATRVRLESIHAELAALPPDEPAHTESRDAGLQLSLKAIAP